MALAQIILRGDPNTGQALSWEKKLACMRFYFTADGIRRLHVSPSRSGGLWMQLSMALAFDLAAGGDGEYVYEGQYFPSGGLQQRPLDWRIPTGETETMFTRSNGPAFGKQLFLIARYPYSRTRTAQLKNMAAVVITRDILASLESRFFKFAAAPKDMGVRLNDENSFDWDRYLTDAIHFFNSWGDVLTWHPRIRHYKYEELKADTVGAFTEILDFWGFDVPEDCIREGFRRASKQEMLKRMKGVDTDNNYRISTRGADRRGIISAARKRHIVDRLKRELIHDFGYDFTYDHDYGIAYG